MKAALCAWLTARTVDKKLRAWEIRTAIETISVSTDSEIDGAQLSEDGRLVLLKPHPTSGLPKWLLWNEADLRQEALSRLREWKIPSRYGSLIRQVESN